MLSHIVPSRSDPVLTHNLFAITIYSFDTALVLFRDAALNNACRPKVESGAQKAERH